MNKPLFLFVGKSSSGKTTIANLLEKEYGYKQVQSYTTRKPRYKGETGHIFVTEQEFNELGQLAAYTLYNGNQYGTTCKQVDECDIYVIDPDGVKNFFKNYMPQCDNDRDIVILYFDASVYTRINRMIERGDCDNAIISRLLEDEKTDWLKTLRQIEDKFEDQGVSLYTLDANQSISNVIKQILFFTNF